MKNRVTIAWKLRPQSRFDPRTMTQNATLKLDLNAEGHPIPRHVYGHFAEHLGGCVYGGLWVGEDSDIPNTRGIRNDVVAALKDLNIPNLRWPGGCFADEYHWRDGIGPREKRPRTVNSLWGGVVETNAFGTHEFLDLCDQLSTPGRRCEPYLAGNVGSGDVREMQEWVQYLTYPEGSTLAQERATNGHPEPWNIRFFGVGNENWGCGGAMHAEHYADLYRRYGEFCRNYGGNQLLKIACGPNADDQHWTRVMMDKVGPNLMGGLSLHYYTTDWKNKGSATDFGLDRYFDTLRRATEMDGIVARHGAVMDERDPEAKVALIVDEWGTWFDVEPGTNPGFLYQQNTVRDALVAGLTLNIFHKHARRVRVANLAQVANVLQAPVLTDGPRMVLTPTYHVLEMFKAHQDAMFVPSEVVGPHYTRDGGDLEQVSASASRSADGAVTLSLCNLHHDDEVEIACDDAGGKAASGRVLVGDSVQSMNTFDQPETVVPQALEGIKSDGGRLRLTLPPHSVAVVTLRP